MITRAKIAPWLLLLLGCNLTSQATAPTVAVSTVLITPSVTIPLEAVAGGPADAGVTVPAQQLVFAFLGQRQGDSLDVPPSPAPGATVTLTREGGPSWSLTDQGQGSYALGADAGFVYQAGATYRFSFLLQGTTYLAQVDQVPEVEHVPAFHPPQGYVSLDAGQPFSFRRPDPLDNRELPLGFVTVIPVSRSAGLGDKSYTDVPTTPLQFLKLVVVPDAWKRSYVTIPGSAFPVPDANYVVLLQSATLGGPASDNLFIGSPVLAGTADLAVVRTRP